MLDINFEIKFGMKHSKEELHFWMVHIISF